MSTLQSTPGLRDRIGSRLGTILLALSVLCAIGVAVFVLVPSRHHAHKPIAPIHVAHAPAAVAPVTAVAAPGHFRDPVTHALVPVAVAAPAPVAEPIPAPPGYFRDPVTHALVRVSTTASGGAPLPAGHTLGRISQ